MGGVITGILFGAVYAGSTAGGITAAAINIGLAAGANALQKKQARRRQQRAQAEAKKQQKKAQRFLLAQQKSIKPARFESPLVAGADYKRSIRNSIAPRVIPYGRTALGGVIVFWEKTGASSEYRHFILVHGEGPIEAIDEVYFDEVKLEIDAATGNVGGKFTNYARVITHTGQETVITGTCTPVDVGDKFWEDDHGLSDGDRVFLSGTLPTPLLPNTSYWVVNAEATGFQLSTTRGGAVINIGAAPGDITFTRKIADGLAVAECSRWTEDHLLLGCAYSYIRIRVNDTLFPNIIPEVFVVVRGRNDIYDLRTGTTGYSTNPALCAAHYSRLEEYSLGFPIDDVNDSSLIEQANVCDEIVNLKRGGEFTTDYATDNWLTSTGHGLIVGEYITLRLSTDGGAIVTYAVLDGDGNAVLDGDGDPLMTKDTIDKLPAPLLPGHYYVIAVTEDKFKVSYTEGGAEIPLTNNGTGTLYWNATEVRFAIGGTLSLANDPEDNLRAICSAMGGGFFDTGGERHFWSLSYHTPTFSIDETMILGGSRIHVTYEAPTNQRFTGVKGIYISENANWARTSFPAVTSAEYAAQDGRTSYSEIQLAMTQSSATAQRIAKATLELSRRMITVEIECSLRVFPAQIGRNVYFTLERRGWVNKVFRIADLDFIGADDGVPRIALVLQEVDAEAYVYDPEDEIEVTDAQTLIGTAAQVANIVADPVPGEYINEAYPLSVALSTPTPGAVIRWSYTGVPSSIASGTAYTGPISLATPDTIYAKAFLNNYQDSNDFTGVYTDV